MSTVSKDIIVLTPNGRRQKVHCSPDTTILQVLEDACAKHGFEATQYDLKHHNHILDPTTTIRFSNLPNKATLEMVEAERLRQETIVTVGLLLEDGERRTADFPPNTSLFELISSLAPSELKSLQNPTVMFMRQEVIGLSALREKTLRQLGLLGGRAILRLLNKADEARQANVSTVYRVPLPENKPAEESRREYAKNEEFKTDENSEAGPSKKKDYYNPHVDPQEVIKKVKQGQIELKENSVTPKSEPDEKPIVLQNQPPSSNETVSSIISQDYLERRLTIEEEVTFVGSQKAVVFKQPEGKADDIDDLPDDFYDLTIEEVRKLYKDLQQERMELEDSPLLPIEKRQQMEKQTSEQRMAGYKNVVVRIQFPDRIILQGIFSPSNTIEDVKNFIKEHLNSPNLPFHIFTTPMKETLNPKMTLLEAKFVPCVLMHFKWMDDNASRTTNKYLKAEIYSRQTSSDAASILASKYRNYQNVTTFSNTSYMSIPLTTLPAPSRRKIDNASESQRTHAGSSSTNKTSKMPKWFKR